MRNNNLILSTPQIGMSGRYRMVVRKARNNTIVRETDWFDNIITNQGLDSYGQQNGPGLGVVSIGTGTTAPAATDTALATFSASTNSSAPGTAFGNLGAPDYIGYLIFARRFNPGSLNGNYSEVGIGWAANTLFSRALILDGSGNPTTITVLSDEYLDVFYELRFRQPTTTVAGSATITGVGTVGFQRRAGAISSLKATASTGISFAGLGGSSSITSYTGGLPAITDSTPSGGTLGNGTSPVHAAYVLGSYSRTSTFTFGLNQSNGAIKTIQGRMSNEGPVWHIAFDNSITKLNTQVLTLTFTASWARA